MKNFVDDNIVNVFDWNQYVFGSPTNEMSRILQGKVFD